MRAKIIKIEYLYERVPSRRQLKITVREGKRRVIVRAERSYESWEQWGAGSEILYLTMPVVEAHNSWLHGGDKPWEEEYE